MPRIKRWTPISHDFNRDVDVIEIRQRFGDWTALAWQEVLHEADRNDGIVRGNMQHIARSLAPISLRKYSFRSQKLALNFLEFAQERGWIEVRKGPPHIKINWGRGGSMNPAEATTTRQVLVDPTRTLVDPIF